MVLVLPINMGLIWSGYSCDAYMYTNLVTKFDLLQVRVGTLLHCIPGLIHWQLTHSVHGIIPRCVGVLNWRTEILLLSCQNYAEIISHFLLPKCRIITGDHVVNYKV